MLKARLTGFKDNAPISNASTSEEQDVKIEVTNDEERMAETKVEEALASVPGLDFSEEEFEEMSEYIDISEIAAKLNLQAENGAADCDNEELGDREETSDPDKKVPQDEWKDNWGIKCGLCSIVVANKPAFESHCSELHPDFTPLYQCSYCNKVMDHYSTFRSHRYRHVTEGRFKCSYCTKGFSVRSLLRVHVESKHAQIKPYICETCGKGFGTKPGLKLHLQKHKISFIGKQWPCNVCGKVLLTSSGLKAHLAVHEQGKRFMCELCGKTFTQKVNMQQHLKGHTGEKPFTCHICGKRFAEKSHLNRHCSFHSDDRPYKCDICGKMYKTERCLKVHLMTHKAERPCKCKYCGKGFLSNNKLKQHYNIHTGDRPFSCKFCERTFTNYPNYLKHTKRRHKEEFAQMGGSLANHDTKRRQEQAAQKAKTEAEEKRQQQQIPVVHPTSTVCNPVVPEAAVAADSIDMVLPCAHDENLIKYEQQMEQPMMSEVMFPVQNGVEIMPVYQMNQLYYQDNYNALPL
ncbi:zinc finger protein 45-like [Neocloeon triangulifer]|uniref:zinc finger protein 45-like n=1 Tax=Neocloeon triangulifer TaxID=2078957 RepID=UPI00286FA903|nr:zinc finger protein 45-like [Neocloeon triangulifer]